MVRNRFSAMLHIPGDVREAIVFYQRAFGAVVGWSTPEAEDMVAQLLVGGRESDSAEFWVHPAGEAIGNPSPQRGETAVRSLMQDREYGWRDGFSRRPAWASLGDR